VTAAQIGFLPGAQLQLTALLHGGDVDTRSRQPFDVIAAQFRIHDVESPLPVRETFLDEGQEDAVLLVPGVEERAYVAVTPEPRRGHPAPRVAEFAGGMLNPSRTVEGEEVIAAGGRGQERTQFLVMPFPMLLQDERKNCNSDEQNRERREERRRRLHDCGGHRCRLLVGALVFGQEKARAVSAWAVGRLGPALRFARTGIFSNFVARTMERTRAAKMGRFLFFRQIY